MCVSRFGYTLVAWTYLLADVKTLLETQSVLVEYFILIGSVHRCETEPTENSILLWDGYVSLLDEHGTE